MVRAREIGHGWITKETIALFGLALGVRAVLSVLQLRYGVRGFPDSPLSTWDDFYVIYAQWLDYVQKGLLPYRDFYTYKYTPLFLYTLYPFFAAAGAKAASIPIILSDSATSVVVYVVAKKSGGNKVALGAGMVYAFAPFVLYYEGYLWLSSQPMTFFLLLAVFLFEDNRPVASFAALAVAVMFKQEALFIMPAYFLLYLIEYKPSLPRGIGLFVAIVVVVSLPFLILAPRDYIGSLNYFQVNLGPLEPAQPVASSIANAPSYQLNSAGTCGLQTIPGLYTGTLCGSVVNLKEFAASLVTGRLNQIASFLLPLLLLLLAPALYVCRRSQNFLQILCIYSLLVCLLLYSDFATPALGYYFVPVYALIFASVTRKLNLILAIAVALLSVTISEGPFQFILPLAFLFLLIAVQELGGSTEYPQPSPNPS